MSQQVRESYFKSSFIAFLLGTGERERWGKMEREKNAWRLQLNDWTKEVYALAGWAGRDSVLVDNDVK